MEQVTGIEPALFQIGSLVHHQLCVTCLKSTWQDLNLRALVPKTSEINRTPLHVDKKERISGLSGFLISDLSAL